MKTPSDEFVASKEKTELNFVTYLKETALALPIATAILYFWGYQYYLGYYRYLSVEVSLFTVQPLDYIIAARLPLFLWLLAISAFLLLRSEFKDVVGPKRWDQLFSWLPKTRGILLVALSIIMLLVTGQAMDSYGTFRARSQGDVKRAVVFFPEPEIAKGKQLYFLGYGNGRYLSYFRADAAHTATLVVLRDEKVDMVVFPGQERVKPSEPTPTSVTPPAAKKP